MNTTFIGVKDFRAHIAEYTKRARRGGERLIIVHRNKPLFEVRPFEEDASLDTLFADLLAARKDKAEGRVYTEEEIMAEFV